MEKKNIAIGISKDWMINTTLLGEICYSGVYNGCIYSCLFTCLKEITQYIILKVVFTVVYISSFYTVTHNFPFPQNRFFHTYSHQNYSVML